MQQLGGGGRLDNSLNDKVLAQTDAAVLLQCCSASLQEGMPF